MKAVIIEDETLVAKELQAKIADVADDVHILQHLPSLKVARRWFLENAEPDVLLMDIQLRDGVSFELFEQFQLRCPVIFTTAYDEYAIRAFKVNGIDYLLKPIDTNDLRKAIEKCRRLLLAPEKPPLPVNDLMHTLQHSHTVAPLYKEKFIVNFRRQWVPVKTRDIACFMRENLNYLHTFSGEKYILDFTTLEEIEDLLDPRVFFRANRQCIVHIENIQSITPLENQKLVLILKSPARMEVDISREKAPGFKKWFDR